MKQVIYNGGTQSYYGCSEPTQLVVGKLYEVIKENDRGWQTDYTLNGIKGEFNSCWFDDVSDMPTTYFAFSNKIPIEGECCKCYRLVSDDDGNFYKKECQISFVKSVTIIGRRTYKATTQNSIYIIAVT